MKNEQFCVEKMSRTGTTSDPPGAGASRKRAERNREHPKDKRLSLAKTVCYSPAICQHLHKQNKIWNLPFEILKFQFSLWNSSNSPHLVATTASPDPIVSVPTLGSWEYCDFMWKTQKSYSEIKFLTFQIVVFHVFLFWRPFLVILDLKLGFYTPKYPGDKLRGL